MDQPDARRVLPCQEEQPNAVLYRAYTSKNLQTLLRAGHLEHHDGRAAAG